jgi:hypothetical protein
MLPEESKKFSRDRIIQKSKLIRRLFSNLITLGYVNFRHFLISWPSQDFAAVSFPFLFLLLSLLFRIPPNYFFSFHTLCSTNNPNPSLLRSLPNKAVLKDHFRNILSSPPLCPNSRKSTAGSEINAITIRESILATQNPATQHRHREEMKQGKSRSGVSTFMPQD